MSTAPRTEATFNQDNQSKVEHNDSHSALFYLFHEVSKLAAPIHNSLFDTNPPSKKPYDASTRSSCVTEKEARAAYSSLEDPSVVKEGEKHLFQSSCGSHRHSLCCMIPYSRVKNVMEEGHSSTVSTLCDPHGDWSSPWKVLSLINLHCERLLHGEDTELPGFSLESSSSSSRVGHWNATIATTMPDVTERGLEDGLESASGQSVQLCEREISSTSAASVEDSDLGSSVEVLADAGEGFSMQIRATKKAAPKGFPQPPQCYRETPHVNKQLELIRDSKKDCFLTEEDHLNVPFAENALQQVHHSNVCSDTQITFRSTYMERADGPKPALTLDLNANVTLSTEQPCNTQLPPMGADLPSSLSGSLTFNTAVSHSLSEQHDRCHIPKEENHPAVDFSTTSGCNLLSAKSPGFWRVSNDEKDKFSARKCRSKTRRKQPHPSRSADSHDPDFQGVTFRIDTEMDDSRQQCRLLITSKYR